MAAEVLNVQIYSMKMLILVGFVYSSSIKFHEKRSVSGNLTGLIQQYFPHESSLCVIQTGSLEESFVPKFHVPVVIFTADEMLQNCGNKLKDQNGYVFIISGATSFETQTITLLQCLSQSTLTLKTKYILLVHFTALQIPKEPDMYVSYFQKLWEKFEITNVAILPLLNLMGDNNEQLELVSYNPFLSRNKSGKTPVITSNLTQDIRGIMLNRFRNMHDHKLKEMFISDMFHHTTKNNLKEKKTLGASPGTLLKYFLESSLNFTFEVQEAPNRNQFEKKISIGKLNETSNVANLVLGQENFKIMLQLLSKIKCCKMMEYIPIGIGTQFEFIVPKPREIESWRLFQYIFQWQASITLGLTILTLSAFTALFTYLQPPSHSNSTATAVVSVLKAVFSVPINKLPRSYSQRFLITIALLLGLIVVTLSCARLFAVMKSKPRVSSIKTLHDVQESNLPIYLVLQSNGFTSILDSFKNTSLSKLRSNLKTDNVYKLDNLFDPNHLNITDRALFYSSGLLNLITSLPENYVFLQYFERVAEPVLSDMMVINLPKGCLYYDHVNEINLRLIASGIYGKWFDAHGYYKAKKIQALTKTNQSRNAPKTHYNDNIRVPLKYKDLEMGFFILYIGLTASVICFITELFYC